MITEALNNTVVDYLRSIMSIFREKGR